MRDRREKLLAMLSKTSRSAMLLQTA